MLTKTLQTKVSATLVAGTRWTTISTQGQLQTLGGGAK